MVRIVVKVRLLIMVMVMVWKKVLDSSGVMFRMVVEVVSRIGCRWLMELFCIVLILFVLLWMCVLILLMSMIVFLISMLDSDNRLSRVVKLKVILVSRRLMIMLLIDIGIMD